MKARIHKKPHARGFNLIELMLASTLVLLLLAATMAVGVQLQRQATFQEQVMGAQNMSRSIRDQLGNALQRAGAGMGAGRISFGVNGAVSDFRYPLYIRTDMNYASPPAGDPTPADSNFALPTGQYNSPEFISDAVELVWGETDSVTELVDCGGGSAGRFRENGSTQTNLTVCSRPMTADQENALRAANNMVVFTNPVSGISCLHKVVSISGGNRIQTTPGKNGNSTPLVTDACDVAGAFWSSGNAQQTSAFAFAARGISFRVNWFTGNPVLEVDPDGVVGPSGFQELSREVERIKLRVAVGNLEDPSAAPVWRSAIDLCSDAACSGYIPGTTVPNVPKGDFPTTYNGWAQDALMRRIRVVELDVTTRSSRPDVEAVARDGANNFLRDREGRLRDGFKRRQVTYQIAPRNFVLTGSAT